MKDRNSFRGTSIDEDFAEAGHNASLAVLHQHGKQGRNPSPNQSGGGHGGKRDLRPRGELRRQ